MVQKVYNVATMQQLKHYVIIGNRKYGYTLRPARRVTTLVCRGANINERFSNNEIPQVLSKLPGLILAAISAAETQSEVMRFRVTNEEKEQIAHNAVGEGFDNISAYIRSKLLGQNSGG